MELEIAQPKSIFSLKSPSSFFAAFRSKRKSKLAKVEEEAPSQRDSLSNAKDNHSFKSSMTMTQDTPSSYMFPDVITDKEAESNHAKPLRKSILIRTTSLPLSQKKYDEAFPMKGDKSSINKGPLKKIASWFGGVKETNKRDDQSPFSDNLSKEKKIKRVTFAIENNDSDHFLSPRVSKIGLSKVNRPCIFDDDDNLGDTSIEIINKAETPIYDPFNGYKTKPTPAHEYQFSFPQSGHPVRPKAPLDSKPGYKRPITISLRENDSVSPSDSEGEHTLPLEAQTDAKIVRRFTSDSTPVKLPNIGTPLGIKKNISPNSLTQANSPADSNVRKLGSFSVRGTSTINLANMLYPINTNLRFNRGSVRNEEMDIDQVLGDDCDFNSQKDPKQGPTSNKEIPISKPFDHNTHRLVVSTPDFSNKAKLVLSKKYHNKAVRSDL